MNSLLFALNLGIILTGQSNMCGFEPDYRIDALMNLPANASCFRAEKRGVIYTDLFTQKKDGLEITFIHRVADAYPEHDWHFVKVCRGGKPIKEWIEGKRMWQHLTKAVDEAGFPGHTEWVATIMMQGEGDRYTTTDALIWDDRADEFISSFRLELNAPKMQLIFGYPGYVTKNRKYLNTLHASMRSYPKREAYTDYVNFTRLKAFGRSDGIHLDTLGYHAMGNLFADTFISQFLKN